MREACKNKQTSFVAITNANCDDDFTTYTHIMGTARLMIKAHFPKRTGCHTPKNMTHNKEVGCLS